MKCLSGRADNTKEIYGRNFLEFCKFLELSPDDLVRLRKKDLASDNIERKRRLEKGYA